MILDLWCFKIKHLFKQAGNPAIIINVLKEIIMKNKVINVLAYVRVSTDDQAKGFSPEYQIEIIEKFCELKGYNILKIYNDDHSAKDFSRPEWQKLRAYAMANKKDIDYVLFHKWDRYSRNIQESYNTLAEFEGWGIELNAVEQWMDMSVPDSRMILSIYLSSGEVERLKISSRVRDCNYQALKEGYYIYTVPYGYKRIRIGADDKASLEPCPDTAHFAKKAFVEVAKNICSAEAVLIKLRKEGFKMSKSNFMRMLRKIVYTGKIFVHEYKGEPEHVVRGLHEAIIDNITFNKVQDILNGKRWNGVRPSHRNELFPLRNYLTCACCNRNMTASSSKGRNKKYHYYHCHKQYRIGRDKVHNMFHELLTELTINTNVKELYKNIIKDEARRLNKHRIKLSSKLKMEIEAIQRDIENLEDKLVAGDIGSDTFNSINKRYLEKLRNRKSELEKLFGDQEPIEQYVDGAFEMLTNLNDIYSNGSYEEKRGLLGSILPEKIIISKEECRTTELNQVIELFSRENKGFREIKNGTNLKKSDLSRTVLGAGLEPARTQCPLDFKSNVSTNSTTRASNS